MSLAGMIDEEGYVHIMSRSDDIINVAAHRLSTGSIEEVLAAHHSVAECCVVGMPDPQKGPKSPPFPLTFRSRPPSIHHNGKFWPIGQYRQRTQRAGSQKNRRNRKSIWRRHPRTNPQNAEWENPPKGSP